MVDDPKVIRPEFGAPKEQKHAPKTGVLLYTAHIYADEDGGSYFYLTADDPIDTAKFLAALAAAEWSSWNYLHKETGRAEHHLLATARVFESSYTLTRWRLDAFETPAQRSWLRRRFAQAANLIFDDGKEPSFFAALWRKWRKTHAYKKEEK